MFSAPPHFVLEGVAGFTPSCSRRIATLHHETLDHAMKRCSIVSRTRDPLTFLLERTGPTREADKVRDGDGRLVIKELASHVALARLDQRQERAFVGKARGGLSDRELALHRIRAG